MGVRIMKKLLVLLLVFSTVCLSSCNFDKAQAYGNEFCYALAESDDVAKKYLHPASKLNGEEFEKFIAMLEQFNEIDFLEGLEIIDSSFTSSAWGVVWDGYKYEYTYEIFVSDKTIMMFCVILDDSQGYGIYSFGIIE